MTESGKKPSKSEIILLESPSNSVPELNRLNFDVFYLFLTDSNTASIVSPLDGFLNILLPKNDNPCICPYFLKQQSHIIRGGENILHPIQKGDILEWKNIYEANVAIALFVPEYLLEDFQFKFDQNIKRFNNGLLTSSDNRITLLVSQLIELNKNDSYLNKLRMQSLIIEALAHQIEGLFAENEKHQVIVNKNHYEKILAAKKLIDKDLSRNFTLSEIAKMVGTNEQYLKKYFKQYFGKTVMNYITEQKMTHAKELILTGEYRVSDVARLTGYKHSTHFTTAFKKHFGFIPNSLKYTFLIAQEGAQMLAELEGIIGIL